MKCPHCTVEFYANYESGMMGPMSEAGIAWSYKYTTCPSCKESIIKIGLAEPDPEYEYRELYFLSEDLVYPFCIQRIRMPDAVPEHISEDYQEACSILDRSPKASAAMARRVLQSVLREQGYKSGKLNDQIKTVLGERNTGNTLPEVLKGRIDVVRNVGNMSAHPFTARDGSEIIDVSKSDADLCLDIVGEVISHYYSDHSDVEQKIANIDEKLDRGGKELIKRTGDGK